MTLLRQSYKQVKDEFDECMDRVFDCEDPQTLHEMQLQALGIEAEAQRVLRQVGNQAVHPAYQEAASAVLNSLAHRLRCILRPREYFEQRVTVEGIPY